MKTLLRDGDGALRHLPTLRLVVPRVKIRGSSILMGSLISLVVRAAEWSGSENVPTEFFAMQVRGRTQSGLFKLELHESEGPRRAGFRVAFNACSDHITERPTHFTQL